ncbi:50S ribosomal protein L25/general stress protein Ctc [Argonema antarcticum]|uniref:50S ribosomal protein L25/general stress protein Ctc n=1 Tax=Argonema antarcticum TaxID=2942763 RepID=UPI0020137294|nr:50S ribosomal protein L25/general stress protein Ctc [Argonema antarcticum]MCL1475848.1 50S ribosomal protein L25/general stress protein Ctc [Argonema antarcticum A004/B2]
MELTVECQKRLENSKPNALRRNGQIPAVLYGHKGAESIALTLNAKVAEQLLKKASINNTLINLNIPDIPWNGQTLLREVQSHSAKGFIYHLSFFAVSAHDTLEVGVPLHFVGEPVGVKLSGGMLDTVMTSIQVKCLPQSIPDNIEVDVSAMNIGDALHIRELTLPPGVTAIAEPNQVVVSVLNTQGGATEAEETAASA